MWFRFPFFLRSDEKEATFRGVTPNKRAALNFLDRQPEHRHDAVHRLVLPAYRAGTVRFVVPEAGAGRVQSGTVFLHDHTGDCGGGREPKRTDRREIIISIMIRASPGGVSVRTGKGRRRISMLLLLQALQPWVSEGGKSFFLISNLMSFGATRGFHYISSDDSLWLYGFCGLAQHFIVRCW